MGQIWPRIQNTASNFISTAAAGQRVCELLWWAITNCEPPTPFCRINYPHTAKIYTTQYSRRPIISSVQGVINSQQLLTNCSRIFQKVKITKPHCRYSRGGQALLPNWKNNSLQIKRRGGMKYCLGNLSNHLSSLHERAELQGG